MSRPAWRIALAFQACLLVCLALGHPPIVQAQERLVFYADQLQPLCYEQDGRAVGEAVDAVRQLCQRAGCEAEFVLAPWPWVLESMRLGLGDGVFTVLRTMDREQYLTYVDIPLGVTRNHLVGCTADAPSISNLEDLSNSMVGVIKDYAYADAFSSSPLFARDESPNNMTMLRKCLGGRLDYIVINHRELPLLKDLFPEAALLPVQPFVVNESPYFIAFSKAHGEKSERWQRAMHRAMEELRAEGALPLLQP